MPGGGTRNLVRRTAPSAALSSGSPKLDNVALGAVRRTKFLVPPPGMTTAQLTYEVPYHFR